MTTLSDALARAPNPLAAHTVSDGDGGTGWAFVWTRKAALMARNGGGALLLVAAAVAAVLIAARRPAEIGATA
mgnify:CR=1 FL=1